MTSAPQPIYLTERQQAILQTLRDEQALTTPMLAKAINARLDVTDRILRKLAKAGLVAGTPSLTGEVGKPPQLWRLRESAAPYIGLKELGSHHYRIPPSDLMVQRETERTLIRQVAQCAGWKLLEPTRPAPKEVPTQQCWRVRLALMAHTQVPPTPALTGLVPPRCNDFVAYREDSPACAVLILHPVRATYNYWTRPRPPAGSQAKRPTPPGRLILYGPLAQQLPDRIAAVFPDEATADPYIERIQRAGLLVVVLETGNEIAHLLTTLARR